jgi:hypothetical protein
MHACTHAYKRGPKPSPVCCLVSCLQRVHAGESFGPQSYACMHACVRAWVHTEDCFSRHWNCRRLRSCSSGGPRNAMSSQFGPHLERRLKLERGFSPRSRWGLRWEPRRGLERSPLEQEGVPAARPRKRLTRVLTSRPHLTTASDIDRRSLFLSNFGRRFPLLEFRPPVPATEMVGGRERRAGGGRERRERGEREASERDEREARDEGEAREMRDRRERDKREIDEGEEREERETGERRERDEREKRDERERRGKDERDERRGSSRLSLPPSLPLSRLSEL